VQLVQAYLLLIEAGSEKKMFNFEPSERRRGLGSAGKSVLPGGRQLDYQKHLLPSSSRLACGAEE